MKLFVKRCVDVVLSAIALMLLCPLFLLLAALVRISSPGPVLFRQARLGRLGRPFLIAKFRTMRNKAEDLRNPDGSAFCGEEDGRVTPLGRLLRKASLDELPQLWNVLRGDMSLVGPRPDQVDQLQYYSGDEMIKLRVRPGITGLAQISGRNRINWQERRRLDAEYVRKWSLVQDLSILMRTIPYVVLRRDIYERKYGADGLERC
ncbi:MAG: sugar transferase [Bryobacterales bacterium]|nr:sugar transferase [Bryobacterales bacterium]